MQPVANKRRNFKGPGGKISKTCSYGMDSKIRVNYSAIFNISYHVNLHMSLGSDAGQVVVAKQHGQVPEILALPQLTDHCLLAAADVLTYASVA